jgi:hypothetical protein
MSVLDLSGHAAIRLAQRALRINDVELAMLIGVEVEGGYLVRDRDSEAAVRDLTQMAERVRRMAGVRIVSEGPTIVTAYHTTRRKRRYLLRTAEARNMKG